MPRLHPSGKSQHMVPERIPATCCTKDSTSGKSCLRLDPIALTLRIPLTHGREPTTPTHREDMTTTPITINPTNVITNEGRAALAILASQFHADLEVLTNEETGEEIGSMVRYDETGRDEWTLSVMPDPYCPHGTGWVAVSDGEAIVTGPTVTETVSRYRDWLHTQG